MRCGPFGAVVIILIFLLHGPADAQVTSADPAQSMLVAERAGHTNIDDGYLRTASRDQAVTQSKVGDDTGIKSWMVKKAVRLLAHAIRHGGRALDRLIGYLDDQAARMFRKHSKRIADGLDEIAEIPDVTVRIVKEKSIYFMANELGMPYGTAQVIGEAIAGALWIFL